MIALLLSVAWASDCPTTDAHDRSLADVEAAMEAAEAVFTSNVGRFGKLMVPVRVTVGCAAVPISPELAARYHRLYALQRDPSGRFGVESAAVLGSLRAARSLEPTFDFDASLLSAGHPMRAAYETTPPDRGATQRVKAPAEGTLWFDGAPSRERPLETATVFQHVADDGAALTTVYLPADAPLPEYALDPVLRRGLTRGALAAGAVAAASWGGALATEARFSAQGTALGPEEAKALRNGNRALFGVAVSSASIAVGLGAGAVVVGPR